MLDVDAERVIWSAQSMLYPRTNPAPTAPFPFYDYKIKWPAILVAHVVSTARFNFIALPPRVKP